MKLVKLSLVAALAAGSMSVLEAKPLEEAIRGVDVSGALRYRFDEASFGKTSTTNTLDSGYGIASNSTPHKFRAFVGTRIDAGDGFKLFGQLMYNNDANGGWNTNTTTTKNAVVLKQAYLQYDAGVASVIFGKQQLNTIWTADFTGMAAKLLIKPTDGLTITAFGVDSFEGTNTTTAGDGDASKAFNGKWAKNMYGAAIIGDIAGLKAQVWGAYWDKVATLYAVDVKYAFNLGNKDNIGIKVTYLGNSMDSDFKTSASVDNGNLVDGRLFAKVAGLDARIGGIYYGDKEKTTVNTIEDITGPDLYIGREMFYANNTALVESVGQSVFGYVGIGYTLPMDLRIGVQGVFGTNTQASATVGADDTKDTRMEGVFELGYKVNRNLSFEGYYSYLNSSIKDGDKQDKSTVRLQALYKF